MRVAVWVALVLSACGDPGSAPADAFLGDDVPCVTLAALPMSHSFGPVTVNRASRPVDFAITNVGNCVTAPVAVTINGSDAQQFSLEGTTCTGRLLLPAEACTASVRFRPTNAGGRIATVHVFGVRAPLPIQLVGFGSTLGPWNLNPGSRAFPGTQVHLTSGSLDFTVTNTLSDPSAAIPSVTLMGADPGEFVVTGTCMAILQPNGMCVVSIAFRPTTTGNKTATVIITDPTLGQLNGAVAGTALPAIELAPSMHDFGATRITTTSAPKQFTLTNVSSIPSLVTITLTGSDAAQYRIVRETCTSAIVAPGGTCDIDVTFTPTSVGAKTAVVHVVDPQLGAVDVPIAGTGNTGGNAMNASPATIDIGSNGGAGFTVPVTVTNIGGTTVGPLSSSMSGTGASSYELVNDTCTGSTLAPSAACTVDVRTTCVNPGPDRSATLTFSATPGGVAAVDITGDINPKACFAWLHTNPSSMPYGNQPVGTTSTATRFTIQNDGGQPTAMPLMPMLSGSGAGNFTITASTCTGVILAPLDSCTVDVAFAPQSAGMTTAVLGVGTANAALSGTGVL